MAKFERQPLYIKIYKRIIAFWHKLYIEKDVIRLSQLLFKFILLDNEVNRTEYPWLSFTKSILDNVGLSYVLNNPSGYSTPWIVSNVERVLSDQFIQNWRENIAVSTKGTYYCHYKTSLNFEPYLYLPKTISQQLLKFRTSNHNLPVETGRWSGIPREERLCPLCNSPAVADEYHYLFKCEILAAERLLYLPRRSFSWPNLHKMASLMNSNKPNTIRNLVKFIKVILKKTLQQLIYACMHMYMLFVCPFVCLFGIEMCL